MSRVQLTVPLRGGEVTDWRPRHNAAVNTPQGPERGLVALAIGARDYLAAYDSQFDSSLADDSVLGDAWKEIVDNTLTLLNGPAGRLDCGTLDGFLRGLLQLAGFEDE